MCRWITVMAPATTVSVEDLPKELSGVEDRNSSNVFQDWELSLANVVQRRLNRGENDVLEDLLKRFESTLLTVALDYTNGHRQNAAKALGWGRNTLTRKMKDLDLDKR